MSSVTGQAHGIGPAQSSARSAPLKTATTPSAARAASRLSFAIRACGYGLRTTVIESVPGSVRLSTNVPRPRRSDASSFRLTDVPTNGSISAATAMGYLTPAAAATALTMLW